MGMAAKCNALAFAFLVDNFEAETQWEMSQLSALLCNTHWGRSVGELIQQPTKISGNSGIGYRLLSSAPMVLVKTASDALSLAVYDMTLRKRMTDKLYSPLLSSSKHKASNAPFR